jgi:hypothetical protein
MDSKRSNVGALVGGALLIAFGALALFGQLFKGYNFFENFWPFIIIAVGVMFFVGMFAGGKSVAGLAIPGSIITVIGLMLFYMNLTDHWESWAYGWALIVFAVGLGIFIMGAWTGDAGTRHGGWGVMKVGGVLFIVFGAFFELIFSSRPVAQIVFPIALILLGVYLVLARSGLLSKRESETTTPIEPPTQGQ